jgi:hypothetical protein
MVILRFFTSTLLILLTGAPMVSLAGELAFVDVTIDEARLIRLDAEAAQIIVGNPSIADAAVQSSRLLVITGKSYGATNLIALDSAGREILNVRLGVREGAARKVTVYRGTVRQSLDCAPECQRTLTIGDDKTQFEQLAESVTKKFGVVNSAISGN